MPQRNPFTKTYHKAPYAAIDPTKPSLSAEGKTVLITAGHTGIGFSIAQNFGAAGAAHVILLARRTAVLEESSKELSTKYPKTKVHYFSSSITDYAKIKEIFSEIRSGISTDIDVLVTSAAYVAPAVDTLDLPSMEISNYLEVHFVANANLVREFLADIPVSLTGREKVILDISSVCVHLPMPKLAVYGVSKLAFTQWLAHVQQDMADKPVRIHSFHPGAVWTEAVKAFGTPKDAVSWDDAQLPGRFAVWLASKEASFLKGRFVWANWDVQELVQRKADFERDPELLRVGLMGL
jgi:short-subunit dehydrogenase